MRKRFLPLFALLAACQPNEISRDNEPNRRTLTAAEIQISNSTNEFAFNLFKGIQKEKPENAFLSPLSVSTALAMTLNGAEGETQQSILNTIDFGDFTAAEINQAYKDLISLLTSTDSKIELGIANSVWYNNSFHLKNEFEKIVTDSYDGTVQGLDFKNEDQSKAIINRWVAQKTHDRIKDLVERLSNDYAMFLINAIYFKGEWTYKFDKSKTQTAPFFTPDGQVMSPLMFSDGAKVNRYANNEITVVDIPYGNEQFSLTVVMPHDPQNLKAVINSLNADDFSYWLSQAKEATIGLELPRFKMKWKQDLKNNLSEMGMRMTNFPNLMQEAVELEISEILHQSFLEVNEDGSEAAAATAVGVVLTSVGPPKITLNNAFVFVIRERHTGAILFIGQLVDPAEL